MSRFSANAKGRLCQQSNRCNVLLVHDASPVAWHIAGTASLPELHACQNADCNIIIVLAIQHCYMRKLPRS